MFGVSLFKELYAFIFNHHFPASYFPQNPKSRFLSCVSIGGLWSDLVGHFWEEGTLKEEVLSFKLLDLSFLEDGASFRGIKLKTLLLFCIVHLMAHFRVYVPKAWYFLVGQPKSLILVLFDVFRRYKFIKMESWLSRSRHLWDMWILWWKKL